MDRSLSLTEESETGSVDQKSDELNEQGKSDIKYVYRILRPGESFENGLYPKNIHSRISIQQHVERGSKCQKSKYISCCRRLCAIKRLGKFTYDPSQDYFTQHHWDNLPSVWTESLLNTEPTELVWLLTEESLVSRVLPFSLLAFRQCTHTYSLPRSQQEIKVRDLSKLSSQRCLQDQKTSSASQRVTNPGTKYHEYLRKHVKPKKLHEIKSLGKALRFLGDTCDCEHNVDVGAGQGHLSRFLTFQHGFKVTTVEAEGCHAPKAQKYDQDAHRQISKGKGHTESEADLPCHVTCYITADTTQRKFLDKIGVIQQV